MATANDTLSLNALAHEAVHLVATCDGGPTFTTELAKLAAGLCAAADAKHVHDETSEVPTNKDLIHAELAHLGERAEALMNDCDAATATIHDLLDDALWAEGNGESFARSPQATLESYRVAQSQKSAKECAERLREHQYTVAENIAVDADHPYEDQFTITMTRTLKGLQYFLAEREYFENLLSDEGGAA